MQRISFHIEAESEVDTAFDWYWAQSPDAAVGFLEELAAIQIQISQNPRLFPYATPTLRKAVLQRHPYYLLFREIDGGVQVLVVAHAKRRRGIGKVEVNSWPVAGSGSVYSLHSSSRSSLSKIKISWESLMFSMEFRSVASSTAARFWAMVHLRA